jgi:L-fuculose-phosphate aldolase
MLLPAARAAIVAACQELSRAGLVVGTAGNVSVREGDLVAVTPSGLRYAELTPELVGVHRLDGTPADAPLAPTSELPLHLAVYAARPEAGAVVHTHSPAATALSTLVEEVPAVHYYAALFGGPVAVARYATYGTPELARGAVAALRDRTACLLGNHGAVTIGPDLPAAHDRSVYLEWLCDVALRACAAGAPRLLPAAELAVVAAKLAGYGQRPPGSPALAGRVQLAGIILALAGAAVLGAASG